MNKYTLVTCCVALLSATSVAAQDAPGVVVAEAMRLPFPLTVEAVGTARANESIEVRPKVTETVTAIRFTEGQVVAKGAVIVELEDAEARAAVAAARARLVDSEAKYVRGTELFKNRLVSASELESLEARRDADRAALDASEARLADTVVRAPFHGRLGLRRVSQGALVSPAVVITTLDDTDTIKLDFDIPETVLSMVSEGLSVLARSAAWPDERFEGTVSSIDTRVDPVSRTVTVRALIPNGRGLLRPGMFLTVEVVRPDVTAVLVPEQAIVPEQSRQYVLVVGDGGVIEKRLVAIGRRRPGAVEILEGLAEGEVIVAEGTQKARPGSAVSVAGKIELPR